MKKIVSVLSVAALTLSAVSAVDVSISYQTRGTIYDETTTHTYTAATGKVSSTQTRTTLNQLGYDSAEGDLAFSAKNDFAGFAFTAKPNAGTQTSAFDTAGTVVDTYYGWMNFGNIQLTTGRFDGRYVALFDGESSNWGDNEYARYKPGVIGGKIAFDIDNLTTVYNATASTTALKSSSRWGNFKSISKDKKVSTAIAYTLRSNEESALMIKGVLVDNNWGSTLRTDKDRDYGTSYGIGGGDLSFFSGFAGEVAYRNSAFDLNFVAKSMKRDELALGAFFRTIGESKSFLFGLSAGLDLSDKKDAYTDPKTKATSDYAHNAREFAFDFRGHIQLTDELCLTTMNNVSMLEKAKVKNQKYDERDIHLWDMVSVAYKVNERLLAQLTGEAECDLIRQGANTAEDGTELYGPSANGGFTITVTPSVKYSFNENATLTTGVALEWNNVGASRAVSEPETGKYDTVSTVKIPVIFKVAL